MPNYRAMRRASIFLMVSILLLASCGDRLAVFKKPNILLISIDTLRADHLGCYGYDRDTSPFIDQLASKGLKYENAFVNTHGTTPSHTTILTSLFQETHRVHYSKASQGAVPKEAVFLQQIFKENGYATLGVTGGGNISGRLGFSRGFDFFNDRSRSIAVGTRRLVRQISEHQESERPIFAFYHSYQVHSPYFPPAEYKAMYGEFDSDFVPSSENLIKSANSADRDLAQEDIRRIVALYDAGIRYTDDTLKQLFSELETMGFLDDAIIVLTSDHGEEFGEHGGLLHRGLLYEELIRVPLIFSGTRVPFGTTRGLMASSIDIAPTLLVNSGIPIPARMQGRPLFLPGRSTVESVDHVISQYGRDRYSVRTNEWKYIENLNPISVELYRLSDDPGESTNLSSEYPDEVRRFHRILVGWRESQEPLKDGGKPVALTEDEANQLKALGYLDGP